jgi:hypothetical protein
LEGVVTDIYYDCEFVEDGRTIDLVSIGMVTDDEREYYAVSSEFDMKRFAANDWLVENVWPLLPKIHGDARNHIRARGWFGRPRARHKILSDLFNPFADEVKYRDTIRAEVGAFIATTDDPQLWSWYGAYDHVVLCQLFGRMIQLPDRVPMWTNDLRQEQVRLGVPDEQMPKQAAGRHNALADAKYHREMGRFLREYRRDLTYGGLMQAGYSAADVEERPR